MKLEDMSEVKFLILQENSYFILRLSEYVDKQTFSEAWHHKDVEGNEGWNTSIQN